LQEEPKHAFAIAVTVSDDTNRGRPKRRVLWIATATYTEINSAINALRTTSVGTELNPQFENEFLPYENLSSNMEAQVSFSDTKILAESNPIFRAWLLACNRILPDPEFIPPYALPVFPPTSPVESLPPQIETKIIERIKTVPCFIHHKHAVRLFKLENRTRKEESKFMEKIRSTFKEFLLTEMRDRAWHYDVSSLTKIVDAIEQVQGEKGGDPTLEQIRAAAQAIRREREGNERPSLGDSPEE
jgi:hypothetical protein